MNEKEKQYKQELLEKIERQNIDANVQLIPRKLGIHDAFYVIVEMDNRPTRRFTTIVPTNTESWFAAKNNVIRHILDICRDMETD